MIRVAAVLALAGVAGQPVPEQLRFVTCPVYRDTDAGRKSGCWLAEDRATGARWDVTEAPSKPDWNRAVLVEGVATAADGGQPCGAPILAPVRTSVLPEPCPRQMLPAEGFPGRRFALPRRNLQPLSIARTPPAGPYAARTFRIYYDHDSAFLVYQYGDYLFDKAIDWIRAAKPGKIVVTGWAATVAPAASGRETGEDAAIAKTRAERIGEALTRMGVDPAIVTVRWRTDPAPVADRDPEADGLVEPSRRRVDIAVEP